MTLDFLLYVVVVHAGSMILETTAKLFRLYTYTSIHFILTNSNIAQGNRYLVAIRKKIPKNYIKYLKQNLKLPIIFT